MQKILAILVMALFSSMTAWSQDQADPPADEQQEQGADPGDAEGETAEPDLAEIDDPILDDQSYEGDDDEFIPTEEVPLDEPIPFPSDI